MVISWICLNLNIVYVIITKMVKIRDSTKPWSPFIHIDRRNSFTLDLRKQGLSHTFNIHCLRFVPTSLLTTQDSLPVVDYSLPDRIDYLLGNFEMFHF